MGLIQCYESDVIGYPSVSPNQITAYALKSPSNRTDGAPVTYACVWGNGVSGENSDGGIGFFAIGVENAPGTGLRYIHNRFDPQNGERLALIEYNTPGSIITMQTFTVVNSINADPGEIWRYTQAVSPAVISGVQIARSNEDPRITGTNPATSIGSVLPADYAMANNLGEAAMDWNNDRVFFRNTDTINRGRVTVYRHSTLTSLGLYLYASNSTVQILPTGDGRVFVIDKYGWFHQYDIDGVHYGSFLNPPLTNAGGYTYGWDARYGRILLVAFTADASPGVATTRIRGYIPVPDIFGVTAPIPREVPRKNKLSYFFSNLYGRGGEPISARAGAMTPSVGLGITAESQMSDTDGDFVVSMTPSASGVQAATISVTGRTAIADQSNDSVLPQATINVWDTTTFAASGTVSIETSNGALQSVMYTGKTATSFTGCTGGIGTLKTGAPVVG